MNVRSVVNAVKLMQLQSILCYSTKMRLMDPVYSLTSTLPVLVFSVLSLCGFKFEREVIENPKTIIMAKIQLFFY